MVQTQICETFGIEKPIIQGGMGPAVDGRIKLAAAVSNAGGLGTISIPSATQDPTQAIERYRTFFEDIVDLTERNFAMNVPVGSTNTDDTVREALDGFLDVGLELYESNEQINDQLALVITSGGNPQRWIDSIQAVDDLLHYHVVGSVKHAKKAEALGVDGVIASGAEMGGHTHPSDEAVHTFVLIPEVVQAVDIPVIGSGGVRDGRTFLGALSLGAQGVQMGTRFILTEEAEWHDSYKDYIIDSSEGEDRCIDGLFGPLRVLKSPGEQRYRDEKENISTAEHSQLVLDAQVEGDIDNGIIIAGQGGTYLDSILTVQELLDTMMTEAEQGYHDLKAVFEGQ